MNHATDAADGGAPLTLPARELYSYDVLERAVLDVDRLTRRKSWMLAGSSVLLGGVLVAVISFTRGMLPRTPHFIVTVVLLLIYLLVLWTMLTGMRVQLQRASPKCPSCGETLDPLASRIALDGGLCNFCGERVLESAQRST